MTKNKTEWQKRRKHKYLHDQTPGHPIAQGCRLYQHPLLERVNAIKFSDHMSSLGED